MTFGAFALYWWGTSERSYLEDAVHSTTYLHTVVNRETSMTNVGSGTAFYLNFIDDRDPTNEVVCLVTNRHNVQPYTGPYYVFWTSETFDGKPNYGESERIKLEAGASDWIYPADDEIDLALLPINGFIDEYKKARRFGPYIKPFQEWQIPTQEEWENFRSMMVVSTIGYPRGYYDTINNIPLVLTGHTAGLPSLSFRDTEEFLVNVTNAHQSSGSPILDDKLVNERSFFGRYYGSEPKLLGVHWATPKRWLLQSDVETTSPELPSSQIAIRQYLDIGLAERSYHLLELKQQVFLRTVDH